MRKLLVGLLILLAPLHHVFAQPPSDDDASAIEALKIAYLSKKLSLTPEEAQKFWPVYNEYAADFKKLRRESKGDELEFREKSLTLIKKYKPEFLKCVGQEKFNRLLKSEGDWRQVVKDEIMRRRQLRQQQRRN